MKKLLLFLLLTTACHAQFQTLGFTCTNNPGEKKECECNGTADCFWMGLSGVCGKDIVLVCDLPPSSKCKCDWATSRVSGLSSFGERELKLKAIVP